MEWTEAIGWIGGTLLALCGLPQAYKTVKEQSARDLSWAFLLMWMGGEILMILYTCIKLDFNLVLLYNYALNAALIYIMIRVKIKELKK